MKFRSTVEPPEPMKGLEVPEKVIEALGEGKRPRVTVTINGHSWQTRIAVFGGRYLIGLSNANRKAAGVEIGDKIQVDVEINNAPRAELVEPEDLAAALNADPAARAAFDKLSYSNKFNHVQQVDSAKKPETRQRRIEKVLAELKG
ncbi:YdeI/OmpD-associated family protein [Kibdelosporangium aridum]|uniref:DUF1905 domain-containing protein n=1 Tax=Kibdelosporangium aridum TaxID=2030 RepID=A0A1W2FUU8_KIBAR|nr:YdeI/OmpD-associated family protein [Kibdelosporangium aridum]SMD25719.1 protein of unknown function [Kibdelosporangium aridum]